MIVARVTEREAAHRPPLATVREQIVETVSKQRAAQEARERGEALLKELRQGASIGTIGDRSGLALEEARAVKRSAKEYHPEVVREVFRLERPAGDAPVYSGVQLSGGDYAVIRLTAVTDGDVNAMDEAVATQLTRGLERMRGALAFERLIKSLRAQAEVVIPEESE